jgi:hypothetical protein
MKVFMVAFILGMGEGAIVLDWYRDKMALRVVRPTPHKR